MKRIDLVESFGVSVATLAVLVCLATSVANGQRSTSSVITPHDIAKLRYVREVAISPDGHRVAYVLNVPRDAL